MINIWTVCVGDKYRDHHVLNIKKMVQKNYKGEFTFNCITDRYIHGVNCINPNDIYPGWWSKIHLFNYASGRCIYFDLDVIITSDITPLVEHTNNYLSMPKNWGLSGHGGFQSSVMCWDAQGNIASEFDISKVGNPENGNYGYYYQDNHKHWGDQEWITYNLGNYVTPIDPRHIISYKYHARSKLPETACVVAFHGSPKYEEVKHEWINSALS
jgi:hypothetical protein